MCVCLDKSRLKFKRQVNCAKSSFISVCFLSTRRVDWSKFKYLFNGQGEQWVGACLVDLLKLKGAVGVK